jgi:hypothetical protein
MMAGRSIGSESGSGTKSRSRMAAERAATGLSLVRFWGVYINHIRGRWAGGASNIRLKVALSNY